MMGPGEQICPECGAVAYCCTVDIGVGVQERGNWHCDNCGWDVPDLSDDLLGLLPEFNDE